ncbi:MAG: DUF2931 family protein [Desulfobacteraceae bacterium]|nr:DUF2931 family protein [Desulfobacteraceae bacterium]
MKKQRAFIVLLAILCLCSLVVAGCSKPSSPPRFDIAFATPEGEPVFIEKAVYDDAWIGHCGIMMCCWKEVGKINVLAPPFPPVPSKVRIRWFNYKQQKYYEATVHLPQDSKKIMRSLPNPDKDNLIITTGVQPDGQVVVWFSDGLSEHSGTWIEVGRTQGQEVPGDPAEYSTHTEDMRKRGEIP